MTRVAAVDCGTNAVRLLVAEISVSSGTLIDLDRRLEITRLGQGVDQTGQLSDAGLSRTVDVLHRYAAIIRQHDVRRVRVVATSATRDAENRDVFVSAVDRILGVPPEVVSGDVEARLSYALASPFLRPPGSVILPHAPLAGRRRSWTARGVTCSS